MRKLMAMAVAFALLAGAPATANDSTASMGAGGLVLEKTDGISMLSEDLYVSAREIRVKYRFLNTTSEYIDTLVAFPMPDITADQYGDYVPDDMASTSLPFITWVNDRAVHTQIELKAVMGDQDITDRLKSLGVPLQPHIEATLTALNALSDDELGRLQAEGLVEIQMYESGDNEMTRYVHALWTLKTTHYWLEYFPPGEEVEIEHLYAPAVGGAAWSVMSGEWDSSEGLDDYATRYCTDADFVAASRRKAEGGKYLTETWIDYILTTGANWAGPIRDFRLVVDKGSEDNLVSFCGEDVKKISPTQFEIRKQNYTPMRDLSVLVITAQDMPE